MPSTTPEVLLVELMKLDPAEHPIVPQILDVVRNYPIQIQRACAEAAKVSADPGTVGPIKAVADEQAVEIQKMLEAFTGPTPEVQVVEPVAEPVVLASEPFKITATSAGLDAPPPYVDAQAAEDARVRFEQRLADAAEEVHEPLIPAALDENHPAQ